VRRRLLVGLAVVVLAAVAYVFGVRDKSVAPRLVPVEPTATIGTGSSAVGVSAEGAVLTWLPPPKEPSLPQLPLSEAPKSGRLAGPALQQARVLGAAPAALRPYVKSSRYGESGVDVELSSGVELRFGDASEAAKKWRAAAAVLADPSVTALDYVDLHAPGRPAIWGSGHVLPSVP
jgi:cell division septal protein FtsQ